MIYIITISLVLFCVFYYDIMENTRNRITVYYLILVWYVAISGLQYCMGSDILIYMREYDETQWSDLSIMSLFGLNNRQFGWILLINLCKSLSSDFVVLKVIQAFFVNLSFFIFFKKQTRYIYTCIFFYSISLYFDFNFNLLRQSIAVAFFLISYKSYTEKKWFSYYLCVLFALLFHNSAVILLFLPVLNFFRVTTKYLTFLSLGVFVGFIAIRYLHVSDLFFRILSLFTDSEIAQLGGMYLEDEKYGQNTASSISFILISLLFIYVIFFNFKNNLFVSSEDFKIFFVFIFILVVSSLISIFARFNFYFLPIVIYLQSNFVIYYPIHKLSRFKLSIIVFFFIFSYSPISSLFMLNTTFQEKQIIQFYPYYSIFDKKLSPERENLWGSY
jgi:hypothetical protein